MKSIRAIILGLIIGVLIGGYVADILRFAQCDFKKPYKAEIIYGVGIITGTGAILGWINIPDGKEGE